MSHVIIHPIGILVAMLILVSVVATLYWMLHPPRTRTVRIAEHAAEQAEQISGNILVIFSADIHSEVMMAIAARMAKGHQARLVAVYVIEVPMTLPMAAELPQQEHQALELLTAATEIGRKAGLEIETRTIRDRQAGPAIIQAARDAKAQLIVMGTFREQRYAGAPLARAIEYVTTQTHTDVLIGVSSATERSMLDLSPVRAETPRGFRPRIGRPPEKRAT